MVRRLDADGNPLIPVNPVNRLSQLKLWHRVDRRQILIQNHELQAIADDAMRDCFRLLALTGLRKNEGLWLKWEHVDFAAKTLKVVEPKNHQDHLLPLSDFLFDMLSRRKENAKEGVEYVFAGEKDKPIADVRWWQNAISEASGVTFTPHDCRRTFATVAESLDIPAYALKRLLNHKNGADVTAGYIVANVERLREPMQRITDFIVKIATEKQIVDSSLN
jgi:integrase